MPTFIKALLVILFASAYTLFFYPKQSSIKEYELIKEELTKYSTCEFEFVYPKKWGAVVKLQTQTDDEDSERESYFITRNFYRFADYDPPKLYLVDNNKGLLWLDVDRYAWGKADKYKPNMKTFCDIINKLPPVPDRAGKNLGIKYCRLSQNNDYITAEWSWQRSGIKNLTKIFTAYKDLFMGRFSGLIGVFENEKSPSAGDKYHLNQLIVSAKIKEEKCP